eukprot:1153046-Pleurochrysis_carterae.AAC.1
MARSASIVFRCLRLKPRSSLHHRPRPRLSTCGACWQKWDMKNFTRQRCTSTTAERLSCPRSAVRANDRGTSID